MLPTIFNHTRQSIYPGGTLYQTPYKETVLNLVTRLLSQTVSNASKFFLSGFLLLGYHRDPCVLFSKYSLLNSQLYQCNHFLNFSFTSCLLSALSTSGTKSD